MKAALGAFCLLSSGEKVICVKSGSLAVLKHLIQVVGFCKFMGLPLSTFYLYYTIILWKWDYLIIKDAKQVSKELFIWYNRYMDKNMKNLPNLGVTNKSLF